MPKCVTVLSREEVTDDMLVKAASLFSDNYGVWSKAAKRDRAYGKPSGRVRMTSARLRNQCLPEDSDSAYVQVTIDGVMAGHAFVCRWKYQGRNVLWVTQLVVQSEFRERGIATSLLANCLDKNDDVFGIMSSHPAACKALGKAFGSTPIAEISMDFAEKHAAGVLGGSPVQYIRDAELCGSLFDPNDSTGLIMGVNSKFYVDHHEALEALESLRKGGWPWPLGELPEGHEFMFLFERPQRRRSF
ncbi:hypothetical protein B0J13DRAFT_15420 [Dactylonectria estremocensis]|uniref:N-acetyltransferase domain-containing protein n=1 Tax=Dactylonectria estremocensis TaxID=1079267 RepID=A0A9P9FJ51_9HYPO|nr:hypothetical protein B0J13DRAFT_15420 [Dactylonectria estremocensis]